MVPSLRSAPLALLYYIAVLAQVVSSAVIEHDFNVTWVWANPDGAFARPVIGINGQFPLPQINATVGDTVVVNLYNALGNQSTSLHFHGMFMNGTSHMDGTTFVSQCAVSPGSTFRYQFEVMAAPRLRSSNRIRSANRMCRLCSQGRTGITRTPRRSIRMG